MGGWNDRIEIYTASGEVKSAEWYNSVASYLLSEGHSPTSETIRELLDPIADYAAAHTFDQWARVADVDMEPGLRKLVDEGLKNPIKDAKFPESDGIDRNREDRIFEANSLFCEFLGDIAGRALKSREMSSDSYDNPIIWMMGERSDKPRPEFKEGAYEIFKDAFVYEIWFVFERLIRNDDYSLY